MTDDSTSGSGTAKAPPYIPFQTLFNLILRMESEGIPRKIDRSYLSNMAGSLQGHVLSALRSLELIGEGDQVMPALVALVQDRDDRQANIRKLISERFPWAIALGTDATQAELESAFRGQGVDGSTLRKAIAFYLHGARFAEIPTSPFFRASRTGTAARRSQPKRGVRKAGPAGTTSATLPQSPEPTNAGAPDEDMRRVYFDLLVKKAEATEGPPDEQLLDRIERLIGLQERGR